MPVPASPEPPPQIAIGDQSAVAVRPVRSHRRSGLANHRARPDQIRRPAGAIDDVRQPVGPRLQQHQPNESDRLGSANTSSPAKKSRFSASRSARRVAARDRRTDNPRKKSRKFGISGPARTTSKSTPRRQSRSAARSRSTVPFLDAVVRQMADDDGVRGDSPARPRTPPVAAGAARRHRRRGPAARFVPAGTPRSRTASSRPRSARRRDRPSAAASGTARRCTGRRVAIGRIGRVAEVQKRRQQERHAEPPGQPQAANDRPGIRERRRVDDVELRRRPPGVAPHAGRDRVARQRQALPEPQRHERQRLEQPAPAADAAGQRKPPNPDAVSCLSPGGQTPAAAATRTLPDRGRSSSRRSTSSPWSGEIAARAAGSTPPNRRGRAGIAG